MANVSQIEHSLKQVLEERANVLAARRAVLSGKENSAEPILFRHWSSVGRRIPMRVWKPWPRPQLWRGVCQRYSSGQALH